MKKTYVRPHWDETIKAATLDPYCPKCRKKILSRGTLQECWQAGHFDREQVRMKSTMVYVSAWTFRIYLVFLFIVGLLAGFLVRGLIR